MAKILRIMLWSMLSVQVLSAALLTRVDTTIGPGGFWSYTLVNEEPVESSNYIFSFSVSIGSPVVVTGIPIGWDVVTDGNTFVTWLNQDAALPYVHDVAPGSSLSGFQLFNPDAVSGQSFSFVSAWDHTSDAEGPSSSALFVPGPTTNVPEGSTAPLLLIAFGVYCAMRDDREQLRRPSGKNSSH